MTDPATEIVLPVPAYFLSDAHLGAVRGEAGVRQHELLFQLLDRVSVDARSLVIVGDLFDFWYEWQSVIPKQHFAVLHKLLGMVQTGIEVHYLAGNHDFRLRGFLESVVGLRVHADAIHATLAGQRSFIYHGDGILKRDSGYRLVKSVLRNPVAQRVFSWIHPDIGMKLARGTSITSRKAIKERPGDDSEYLRFAQSKFKAGFQNVVMGHTHRPVLHREAGNSYVNLGDWINFFTYAVHNGNELRLEQFVTGSAQPDRM